MERIKKCPGCGEVFIMDHEETQCPDCSKEFEGQPSLPLADYLLKDISDDYYLDKTIALCKYTNSYPTDIESDDETHFRVGKWEYLVLTDSEADERMEEELDSYLDECVLSEVPEHLQHYFDRDKWKHDAKMDGRCSWLSPYDGNEGEEEANGEYFYIYRIN